MIFLHSLKRVVFPIKQLCFSSCCLDRASRVLSKLSLSETTFGFNLTIVLLAGLTCSGHSSRQCCLHLSIAGNPQQRHVRHAKRRGSQRFSTVAHLRDVRCTNKECLLHLDKLLWIVKAVYNGVVVYQSFFVLLLTKSILRKAPKQRTVYHIPRTARMS